MEYIPHYKQPAIDSSACVATCFRMVFAYYGIKWPSWDEFFPLIQPIGENARYTTPWGNCLAAAKLGLTVHFLSNAPAAFNEAGYPNIMTYLQLAGDFNWTEGRVRTEVEKQIRMTKRHERIRLIEWEPRFNGLFDKIAREKQLLIGKRDAVLVPIIPVAEILPHAIVLQSLNEEVAIYNDPNSETACSRIPRSEFDRLRRRSEITDNDLYIISKRPIVLEDYLN